MFLERKLFMKIDFPTYFEKMLSVIKKNECETLAMVENDFNNHEMGKLTEALKENSAIKKIIFNNFQVSEKALNDFFLILKEKKEYITHLSFIECKISNETLLNLSSFLVKPSKLEEIYIDNVTFADGPYQLLDFRLLWKSIEDNCSLKKITLQRLKLSDKEANSFINVLCTKTQLTYVSLQENEISHDGAFFIAKALAKNSTIEIFNISHNRLGTIGLNYFAQMLEKNTVLKELNIGHQSCNNVDRGTVDFSRALQNNAILLNLNISNNAISAQEGEALWSALRTNTTLKVLELKANPLERDSYKISKIESSINKLLKCNKEERNGKWEELNNKKETYWQNLIKDKNDSYYLSI